MKKFFLLFIFACVALLALPASAQDLPNFSELPVGEWTNIALEEGVCLYDTAYSFFVRPASEPTDNLMIYFQGGGACWDGYTCGAIGEFAKAGVDPQEITYFQYGMFDFTDERNPVANYNIVFVPYCSGDVHTGSTVMTFDVPEELESELEQVTVQFNGFNNGSRVLDWVYKNFRSPSHLFITGCSAGGYGATSFAPYIMNQYPDVPAVHFADSANGVTPAAWAGLDTWGLYGNLPNFVVGMEAITAETYSNSAATVLMANAFPQNTFAQYNTFLDVTQVGFYGLIIGQPVTEENFEEVAGQWAQGLLTNLATIDAQTENFVSFTAGGTKHCIDNDPLFYEYEAGGVLLVDWLTDLLAGEAVESVSCNYETDDCIHPPVEEPMPEAEATEASGD